MIGDTLHHSGSDGEPVSYKILSIQPNKMRCVHIKVGVEWKSTKLPNDSALTIPAVPLDYREEKLNE